MADASRSPLLAIVTVTRNDSEGLRRTLRSIGGQQIDWRDVEHVVVDGASTDDTTNAFASDKTPVSRIVSEPDQGVYDAMNKALGLVSAPYIQYLNSGDTLADGGALQAICGALVDEPVWLVGRAMHLHGGVGEATLIPNFPHVWWRHALGVQSHCHQATVFSTVLLRQLGGHSQNYSFVGDFDAILRAGLVSRPAHLDRVIVNYAGGGISAVRAREVPRMLARVREDRFELTGSLRRANNLWAHWRRLRHDAHMFKGARPR